ncbi:ATP-binding protein [Kineococcus sp. NBC_00420]|uniref:ATP-binding protein n=1 Tax=Kineococcus sp. NBC_00420 TaxID=2903564 RepID=UPI002E1DB26B
MQDAQLGRRMADIAATRLTEEQVLLIEGPRSVGKSTLLRHLATQAGVEVIDLDDLDTREAVSRDLRLFAAGDPPVCFDEYQKVPLVLDAIKAELNHAGRPGRFVLAGSTRFDALPTAAQSLTGRLHRLTLRPFSQGELDRHEEHFLPMAFETPKSLVELGPSRVGRDEVIRRVTTGGFPLAVERPTTAARNRWFDDYVRLTLERDVRDLSRVRQAAALPQLLERLAGQTAQVLNVSAAAASVGLDDRTADGYTKLLEAVFLLQRIPAWARTTSARSALRPKVHLVDSGVAARLLRLTPEKLGQRSAVALQQFGHLLETFAVMEVAKQASWRDDIDGLHHWRTHDGLEVDLAVERDDGTVIGIEIKAGGRLPGDDFRGLRALRDQIGEQFVAGYALYLGEHAYTYEDRLHALPLDRLWTA